MCLPIFTAQGVVDVGQQRVILSGIVLDEGGRDSLDEIGAPDLLMSPQLGEGPGGGLHRDQVGGGDELFRPAQLQYDLSQEFLAGVTPSLGAVPVQAVVETGIRLARVVAVEGVERRVGSGSQGDAAAKIGRASCRERV